MSDKRKRLARNLSKKTGMSYQAAINVLAASKVRNAAPTESRRSVDRLLAELRAESTFSVAVFRAPAVGASADLTIARRQSQQLAEHPLFCAETGAVTMGITREEYDTLMTAGAGDEGVQMIRAAPRDGDVTFSEKCSACRRWIWCGNKEREARCFCGQQYRVVFDLAREGGSLAENIRCMDCGIECSQRGALDARSPWLNFGGWQRCCSFCVHSQIHSRGIYIEQREGKRVVRFTSVVPRQDVESFVAYSKLEVDWSKAARTVMGEINGRTIEQWSLPIIESRAGIADYGRRTIERTIADGRLLAKLFGESHRATPNQELWQTLRKIVDALQSELDSGHSNTAYPHDRREMLIAAARRLMTAGQMNHPDVNPAMEQAESALSWPHRE